MCAETSGFQDPTPGGGGGEQEADLTTAVPPPQPEMSAMDMPMPTGDGIWTGSLDNVFADFMQWWDFTALQTDMVQSDEYSPEEGFSNHDTQMAQPFTELPHTLMSGSDRLM